MEVNNGINALFLSLLKPVVTIPGRTICVFAVPGQLSDVVDEHQGKMYTCVNAGVKLPN